MEEKLIAGGCNWQFLQWSFQVTLSLGFQSGAANLYKLACAYGIFTHVLQYMKLLGKGCPDYSNVVVMWITSM